MDTYEKVPSLASPTPVMNFPAVRQFLKTAEHNQLRPEQTRRWRAEALFLLEVAEAPLGKHLISSAKRMMAAQMSRFGFVIKTRETGYQTRRRPREIYTITPAGLVELRRLLYSFGLMVPRLNPLPNAL